MTDDERLQAELAHLPPEDRARLIKIIQIMRAGAEIEPEFLRGKTPEELRAFADALPEEGNL